MKETLISILIGAADTVTKGFIKDMEDREIRTIEDHPNNGIIKICQNTLGRIAVTQTPVENHQLMLVGKKLLK